jgi:hypothetical protein
MIFELAQNSRDIGDVTSREHRKHWMLDLFKEAVQRDVRIGVCQCQELGATNAGLA